MVEHFHVPRAALDAADLAPNLRLLTFWPVSKVIQISFHSLLCLHSKYEFARMAWRHRALRWKQPGHKWRRNWYVTSVKSLSPYSFHYLLFDGPPADPDGKLLSRRFGTNLLCVRFAEEPHRIYRNLDKPKGAAWTRNSRNTGSFAGTRSPD